MCEMCLKPDAEPVGFGICKSCEYVECAVSMILHNPYIGVSPKNVLRYMLTKDHEVNARGDHESDHDSCVNMHADCTHD